VQTGDESELRPGSALRRLNRHSYLQWSVSADWLLVVGRDADRLSGWFKIDVASSAVRPLLENRNIRYGGPGNWAITRDGKYVYFARGARWIERLDIEKETVRTIHDFGATENDVRGLSVSPDGRRVAAVILQKGIVILSSDGSEVRTLYRPEPGAPGVPAEWTIEWSPDGTRLLFGIQTEGDVRNVSLWQIPLEGGEAQALGIVMPGLKSPRIHPDGRRMLFLASTPGRGSELWAVDNVLAQLNASE